MEKITRKEMKADFESHYNYIYKSDAEFERAVEAGYQISETEDGTIFHGDCSSVYDDFIVIDWEIL